MNFKKLPIIVILIMLFATGCSQESGIATGFTKDYGVFLNIAAKDYDKLFEYETVVIDAEFVEKDLISSLKSNGQTVYSYLNIGSIEDFRENFDDFSGIILGEYDNWEGEYWVDVSLKKWQEYIAKTAENYLNIGIDGFFIDNCDVYYNFQTDEIFNGLVTILENLRTENTKIIINGGDTFVKKYNTDCGNLLKILTGVNQETVFSGIDFKENSFFTAKNSDKEYYLSYLKSLSNSDIEVFLLEYTQSKKLEKAVENYCQKNDWKFYISNSIDLD